MPFSAKQLKSFNRLSVLFFLFPLFGANARADSTSDLDRAAAERHFQHLTLSLHDADRFSDGAKGQMSYGGSEGYSHFVETPNTFKTRSDFKAHLFYCSEDAIVLATYVDSESPVLTSNKTAIYTASHFIVKQTIKGDSQMVPGTTIVTYRAGGEVTDAGEVLRLSTPNAPSYRPGRNYLLFLNRDRSASVRQYMAGGLGTGDEGTTIVSHNRVYPSLPSWIGFKPGTTLADMATAYSRASTLGCN